jgi:hypothetical protein
MRDKMALGIKENSADEILHMQSEASAPIETGDANRRE